jgi:hypothetical protein
MDAAITTSLSLIPTLVNQWPLQSVIQEKGLCAGYPDLMSRCLGKDFVNKYPNVSFAYSTLACICSKIS